MSAVAGWKLKKLMLKRACVKISAAVSRTSVGRVGTHADERSREEDQTENTDGLHDTAVSAGKLGDVGGNSAIVLGVEIGHLVKRSAEMLDCGGVQCVADSTDQVDLILQTFSQSLGTVE